MSRTVELTDDQRTQLRRARQDITIAESEASRLEAQAQEARQRVVRFHNRYQALCLEFETGQLKLPGIE